ncbi:MAG: DUF1684 domain-containing protein [Bacteroidales bacterium]|nr:DUF1684 domain-containing protein [Bacteroidales bacterium]
MNIATNNFKIQKIYLFYQLLLLAILMVPTVLAAQTEAERQAIMDALSENDRLIKEEWMANDEDSPLTEVQREQFDGLSFYPVDPSFKVFARLERDEVQQNVEMKTSQNVIIYLVRYGKITFSLKGTVVSLTIFRDQNLPEMSDTPGRFFIPFADMTTGRETSSLGRYLIFERPANESNFMLDFNKAINPYAAYNSAYNSIIPPQENYIPLEITAGEKNFSNPR